MFENPRFVTKGFQSSIPITTQLILFHMLDSIKHTHRLDYLQVFTLSIEKQDGQNLQKIVLSQEKPPRSKVCLFPLENPVAAKIFVIDDYDHHTFLLAEEY